MTAPARDTPTPTDPAAQRPPWSDVLASLEDGVVVVDGAGDLLEVTPAAEPLLGYAGQPAPRTAIESLAAGEPANAWRAELCRRTLADGAVRRRSEGVLRRGRQETPVLASCAPVLDRNGGVAGAVLILHDLTVQRDLEAQTRRAERLATLGPIALGLAHEIRNPLGGIKGAAQLTQVFLNLVKNALEAMGGAGTLRVSTRIEHAFHIRRNRRRGQMLTVLVDDTGPGIEPDVQADLFAPFFTTKADGSGLGLAVCQRIVMEHGGTMRYEDRVGGGARFRVTLPVNDHEHDATD